VSILLSPCTFLPVRGRNFFANFRVRFSLSLLVVLTGLINNWKHRFKFTVLPFIRLNSLLGLIGLFTPIFIGLGLILRQLVVRSVFVGLLSPIVLSLILNSAHCAKIISGFHSWLETRISRDSCVFELLLYLLWQNRFVVERRINNILLNWNLWLPVIYLLLYPWHVHVGGHWGRSFRRVSLQGPFDAWLPFPRRRFFGFLGVKCAHPSIGKLLHFWLKHHLPETLLIWFVTHLWILVFEWRSFHRPVHRCFLHITFHLWADLKFLFLIQLVDSLVKLVVWTSVRGFFRGKDCFV